jgi:hypothetical protein
VKQRDSSTSQQACWKGNEELSKLSEIGLEDNITSKIDKFGVLTMKFRETLMAEEL